MNILKQILPLVAVCSIALSNSALAKDLQLSTETARAVVEEFMTSVSSYQADFTQTLYDQGGEAQEEEAGYFWLLRPGRFRWQYTDPWEREIVANTESIWVYDVDLEQVTIRAVGPELMQSPAALLVGDSNALEDYEFSGIAIAGGGKEIRLKPVSARNDFSEIILTFDAAGMFVRLSMLDRLGQLTVVDFTRGQRNPTLEESIFVLAVPNGVDVLDQRPN